MIERFEQLSADFIEDNPQHVNFIRYNLLLQRVIHIIKDIQEISCIARGLRYIIIRTLKGNYITISIKKECSFLSFSANVPEIWTFAVDILETPDVFIFALINYEKLIIK
jgi:hypothetical protein